MMTTKISLSILFGAFIFTAGFCSAEEMKDTSTGQTFPEKVTFDHQAKTYTLTGTGVSTRKKFFVKVYSIASYLENPEAVKGGDVYSNILKSDQAKQLTSKWVRNVGKEKVQDGYRSSLREVTSENDTEIEEYVNFFGDVKSGDTHIIRWLPGGTITVTINGEEKGSITSRSFAEALWAVWFGKNSVVSRTQLISKLQ